MPLYLVETDVFEVIREKSFDNEILFFRDSFVIFVKYHNRVI
jgi:hypothetical protein